MQSYELDSIPCYYIGRRLRWVGIHVTDEKEKYGTWRVYCSFGLLHNSTLAWKLNLHNFLFTIVYPVQKRWYRYVYRMALRKFPDEAEAILMGSDYASLLMGLDSRMRRIEKDGWTEIRWEEHK